jgi:hypothetical protein
MMLNDSANALGTLLAAALFFADGLAVWHIYAMAAMASACAAFQSPAYAATVPTLLSKDQLSRANGLVQAARSATSLLAPIIGGFLVAVIGLGWILVIDLATFGIAVVTLLCLRFPSLKQSDGLEAKRKRHLLADIAAGLRYVRVRPGLLGLFIVSALAGLFGASADMLLAPYVLSFSSAQTLGWITAAVGAGFLMGDVVMSVWRGPA